MTDQPSTAGTAAPSRTILITGNQQILGRPIAARLGRRHTVDHAAVVTIGPPKSPMGQGTVSMAGSLTSPRFGLSRNDYLELVTQVDAVVHLSSSSTFTTSPADDVSRTRRVLDFIEQADARLYWVDAAFVDTGSRRSRHRRMGWPSEDSRLMVESLLRTSAPDHVMVRPSIMIGNSRTGAIAAFPGIYRLLTAMLAPGSSPAIAVDPNWRLDLMPCDVVADVIARLVHNQVTDREVWLTMGERALTIEQVYRLLQTFYAEAGWDASAPCFQPAHGERDHDEPFLPALPTAQRRVITRLLDLFTDRLAHVDPLESSLGDEFANSLGELGAFGVEPLPEPGPALLASLRYWRRVTGGGTNDRWNDHRVGAEQDAVA